MSHRREDLPHTKNLSSSEENDVIYHHDPKHGDNGDSSNNNLPNMNEHETVSNVDTSDSDHNNINNNNHHDNANSSTSSNTSTTDSDDEQNERLRMYQKAFSHQNDVPEETEEEKKKKEFERNLIRDLLKSSEKLVEGHEYYLISARWWNKWEQYVHYYRNHGFARPHPGPIDNDHLLEKDKLKVHRYVHERYDYNIIGIDVWKHMKEWYGGGPEIVKTCIRSRYGLVVEVRPLELKLFRSSDLGPEYTINCSKSVPVGKFIIHLIKKFNLDPSKIRLWDFYGNEKRCVLKHYKETLSEAGINDNQNMLLEEMTTSGRWPTKKYYKKHFGSNNHNYRAQIAPSDPGKTGLYNLGNTCFMNSALQCLSNTPPLTDYFLSQEYIKDMDINGENPLSMKGKLAKEYCNLLTELWSSSIGCSEPREFKKMIGKFAPQFSGYDQHDSQEFLSFLLDGLHEDLNRVKKKPYIPTNEGKGRPDEVVAAEEWDTHKKRNNSIIVELFQGQLKSTVTCPDCKNRSITFDPFMYLSVPLPVNSNMLVEILLFKLDTSQKPIRYGIPMDKKSRVHLLKDALAGLASISNPRSILLLEVSNSRFLKEIEDRDRIDEINDNNWPLHAYETVSEDNKDVRLLVLNKKEDSMSYNFPYFGTPLVICVKSDITYKDLYKVIIENIKFQLEEIPSLDIDYEDLLEDPMNIDNTKIKCEPIFELSTNIQFRTKVFKNYNGKSLNLDDGQTIHLNWKSENIKKYFKNLFRSDFDKHESYVHTQNDSNPTLHKSLDLFTTEEQLGPNDTWYCSNCKDHKQAFKKFDIFKVPPLLIIHLKRFSYARGIFREKLDVYVDFPSEIDLTNRVSLNSGEKQIYELYAISNHYGSLGGGHYTAYCKHRSGDWHSFDDSSVSKTSEQSAKTKAAYVLFYKKKDYEFQPFKDEYDTKIESSSESEDDVVDNSLVEFLREKQELLNNQENLDNIHHVENDKYKNNPFNNESDENKRSNQVSNNDDNDKTNVKPINQGANNDDDNNTKKVSANIDDDNDADSDPDDNIL